MSEPESNAEQIAYWNGRAGTAWTELHDRTDAMLSPITPALMAGAHLEPGERVLDVGCGCGETTLRAADAVGRGGSVVGLDVSEPMLALARARGAGRDNVEWRLEDAATASLAPRVDAVISRFGVMFFDDPIAAFRNLHASIAPGSGRLVFVCWQHPTANEWVTVPMAAARSFIPDLAPPAPGTPGPFAFADADRVRAILRDAGFVDIAIDARSDELPIGRDADDVLFQLGKIGPLARAVADLPPDVARRALEAARDAVVARVGATLTLPGAYWLVSARG